MKTATSEVVKWKTDTVVLVDWRRDTVEIIERGDTVRMLETRWRDRVLWRSATAADTVVKTVEVKGSAADCRRKRSRWWLWLLIGLGGGAAAPFVWKLIRKMI